MNPWRWCFACAVWRVIFEGEHCPRCSERLGAAEVRKA